LGEAQSRNPNWLHHAVESFETALRLSPREAGYRVRLAQLLEERGRIDEAAAQYREALDSVPGHPEAEQGLARLAPRTEAAKDSVVGHLRKLLGRK
jgi:Flp pilus assembly protein TadD